MTSELWHSRPSGAAMNWIDSIANGNATAPMSTANLRRERGMRAIANPRGIRAMMFPAVSGG